MPAIPLFAAQTTNGNSTALAIDANKVYHVGGQVTGTFGGATVKLQVQLADDSWVDVSGASFTAAGQFATRLVGKGLRYNCAGGTGQSINATIIAEVLSSPAMSSKNLTARANS